MFSCRSLAPGLKKSFELINLFLLKHCNIIITVTLRQLTADIATLLASDFILTTQTVIEKKVFKIHLQIQSPFINVNVLHNRIVHPIFSFSRPAAIHLQLEIVATKFDLTRRNPISFSNLSNGLCHKVFLILLVYFFFTFPVWKLKNHDVLSNIAICKIHNLIWMQDIRNTFNSFH